MEKLRLRVNHFPLRSELRVARSCYHHSNPRGYCGYLRIAGYDATEEAGHVIVYHAAGIEPDDRRKPVAREILSASSPAQHYARGVNAHIDQLLRCSGFVRVGQRGRREYISSSKDVQSIATEKRGPSLPSLNVHAHLRWTWDLEWYEGALWLVPLPGQCFLTAQEPRFPALARWLRLRLSDCERTKVIDLQTGKHRTLALRGDEWGTEKPDGWEPLAGDGWRVCLNMHMLAELGYSAEAFHSAQFTFGTLHAAFLSSSPFGSVVNTTDQHVASEARAGIVPGAHLRFHRGTARDMKEVHRLGVLEPPPRPVRLLVVASQKDSSDKDESVRHILNAHLADRSRLRGERGEAALRSVGAADGRDTIATIWTKGKYGRGFELPSFTLAKTRLHLYDPKTGDLVARPALEDETDSAQCQEVTLIALVLLDDDMTKPEHDRLMRQFRRMKAVPIKISSIATRSGSAERSVEPKWLNLTLALAQKAGAIPWDLNDLPGVDEQTVFVGIDLGHDHTRDRSQIAFTLFDPHGRPTDNCIVHCRRNDERIPSAVLDRDLCRFIFDRDGPAPTQVIVHRDGRFLPGEADDLIGALQGVPRLTVVGIKKDACTRLSGQQLEGAFVELGERRAFLVTNCQSQHTSMPAPIEVEIVYSNQLNLRQVVAQVFWLTRICQGNAYLPRRLPATTGWANNVAGTGRRVHLKGWEYSGP